MKKKEEDVRRKMIVVRVNEAEHLKLLRFQQGSTEKTVSTYLRKVALNEPVFIYYRNQSADDFLNEMVLLKNELSAIGNNFNQVVHKLHMLDRIPKFRMWIQRYENVHQHFIAKTEQILLRSDQIYRLWLQG